MGRTKNQIRASKSKGSQFERDVKYTLQKYCFEDLERLGGEGQWREIDLESKKYNIAIECKRHKAFSWNELLKYFEKLQKRAPNKYCVLIFQANRQPPLVMALPPQPISHSAVKESADSSPIVLKFEQFFPCKLEKAQIQKEGIDVSREESKD